MGEAARIPSLKNGTVLNGKWEIIDHIATGGKGEVYRARQTNLDREVVVKTISKEYLAELDGDEDDRETELQRFRREALAMAKVRHPYIVQVYDRDDALVTREGVEESVHYLVMEYIDGKDLRSTMPPEGFSDERLAREWIRDYFLPLLEGIESIHELGIVHRDVKPENVLLENGAPKITDFGIAGGIRWSPLTKSRHVEGTITYMAPEQFMALGETDVRGDVYALGKILYEAVVGALDKKNACLLKSVCLPSTGTPFLKKLDLIVCKATAENAEDRTPSVKNLREQLEGLLEEFDRSKIHVLGFTLPRPDRRRIIILMVALTLVIGLVVVSNLIHHAFMVSMSNGRVEPQRGSLPSAAREKGPESGNVKAAERSPGPGVPAKDGSILMAVPRGDFRIPGLHRSQAGSIVHTAPFLMGETEVTNAQYVKFLNRVLSEITVVDGTVRSYDRTWFILGSVFGGYEPIVYKNGKFSLKDPRLASYPVVRVTGQGAEAYAKFFGLALPTEFQWYAALRSSKDASGKSSNRNSNTQRDQTDLEREMAGFIDAYGVLDKVGNDDSYSDSRPSRIPHDVSRFPRNYLGIRGLRSNIGEWGLISPRKGPGLQDRPGFVVLGGLEGTWLLGTTLIRGPKRKPSEAFAHVGFRVVRETTVQPRGKE